MKEAGLRVISLGFDLVYDYVSISDDPSEYAADLYTTLHQLDNEDWDRIVIEMPPDTPEWAAIRDRLFGNAAVARLPQAAGDKVFPKIAQYLL